MMTSYAQPHSTDELFQTRQAQSLDSLVDKDLLARYAIGIQGKDQSCELDLAPVLIGRDPSCQIAIPSPEISRFHAVIHRVGRQIVIRDLHSTNGVELNGVRVYQAPLRLGDQFRVGGARFSVVPGRPRQQQFARQAAVMFMDIADSTRMNETHGPAFSQAVHAALSRVEDQLFWQLGCPLKHLGDGLMGAFGIWPNLPAEHSPADAALKTALDAIKLLQTLPEYPETRLRVGLAFGEVSVREHDMFDLFGDTVSLASRMENSNKHYGTQLMMSESFFRQLKFKVGIREIDTVTVQGKSQPVNLYTWDERLATTRNFLHSGFYHMGLEQYRRGDFAKAGEYFARAASAGDAPSELMRRRAERLQQLTPQNWNGVWQLDKA